MIKSLRRVIGLCAITSLLALSITSCQQPTGGDKIVETPVYSVTLIAKGVDPIVLNNLKKGDKIVVDEKLKSLIGCKDITSTEWDFTNDTVSSDKTININIVPYPYDEAKMIIYNNVIKPEKEFYNIHVEFNQTGSLDNLNDMIGDFLRNPNSKINIDKYLTDNCYTNLYIYSNTPTAIPEKQFYAEPNGYGLNIFNSIHLMDNITSIGSKAFYYNYVKEVYIGDGVESIASDAFQFCGKLETVKMTDNVKDLGASVFRNCPALKNVTLSNNIKVLPSGTFELCTSLESVNLPNKIDIIGSIFSGCTSLKTITIPASATTFNYALNVSTATSLEEIIFEDLNSSWDIINIYGGQKLDETFTPTADSAKNLETLKKYKECNFIKEGTTN